MKPTAPDWAIVIEQIKATGLTELQIAQARGIALSVKAVRYLATGVQPLFHRGDALVDLWCERTGKARADVPLAPVLRGHRMARRAADQSPKATSLPVWPPAPAPTQRKGQGAKRAPKIPATGKAKVPV